MKEKKDTLIEYLRRGIATVVIDSRQQGVDVPEDRRTSELILNLSYRYEGVSLEVTDWGVRCQLSFAGANCPVAFPWGALFFIRSAGGEHFAGWDRPEDPLPLTKRRGVLGLA